MFNDAKSQEDKKNCVCVWGGGGYNSLYTEDWSDILTKMFLSFWYFRLLLLSQLVWFEIQPK